MLPSKVALDGRQESLDGGVPRRGGRGAELPHIPTIQQDEQLVQHGAKRVRRVPAQGRHLAPHRVEPSQVLTSGG